jgi:ElaB protein
MSTTFESDRPAGTEQPQAANGKLDEQFRELFDGVEDLIKRVSEVNSPEVQKIRAKARVALMVAKSAIADGATHVGKQARRAAGSTQDYVRRAAGSTDDYVREYPWYALGAGALVGFALGVLVSRSRD